ncbi:MAG: hypothetical protein ACI4QR_00680 [Eubacteriales bacterium]
MRRYNSVRVSGHVSIKILLSLILASIFIISFSSCKKSMEKNYGLSYVNIKVITDENGELISDSGFKAENVVPSYEALIENLGKSGYKVDEYESFPGSSENVKRVYASKGKSFIDICYCTSSSEAEELFEKYEKTYRNFYIMAQNDSFVYCVSDKKTFGLAGFTALSNNGIQYIYN